MTDAARYAIPLLSLSALTAAFFLPRAFRPIGPRTAVLVRTLAVAPLFLSGAFHLLAPQAFVALLPPPFPPRAWLIVLTGLPELLGAIGLLWQPTRRAAALCLSVFLIAIVPANIYVAGQTIHGLPMPGVPVRTAMQGAYLLLVLVAGWGVPRIRRNVHAAKAPLQP